MLVYTGKRNHQTLLNYNLQWFNSENENIGEEQRCIVLKPVSKIL